MHPSTNIVLIGLRGAGKTTVGRLLAAGMGRPFIDLDDVVLRRLGATSVRGVFAAQGEATWRDGELGAAESLFAAPLAPSVIAIGGGAPAINELARRLHDERRAKRAFVVHLSCAIDVAAARLAAVPGDRVSLTGTGIVEELSALAAARSLRYEELADSVIDAEGAPETVVARIASALRALDL